MRHSRPAPHRRWAPLSVALILTARLAVAADDERVNLRAEFGLEYDSNVHRAEQIAGASGRTVLGSPLARAVLGVSAADRLGTRQDVAFSVLGAGKWFAMPEAHSENVAVIESAGAWRLSLSDRTRVGIGASYYEALQSGTSAERDISGDARDFRSLVPTFRMLHVLGQSGTITVAGGYRFFVYKPIRDYDFGAPVLSAQYHLAREASDGAVDWDFVVGTSAELRRFQGTRLLPDPPGCTATGGPLVNGAPDPPACVAVRDMTGARHIDQFVSGYVDLTRTGRVLVGAAYTIQWNRSNSYAETLVRHVGTVRFTAPLPLGLYLAARAELVYVTYADSVALAVGPSGRPSATIDDENRSHLRAELSRDVAKRMQLVGRYSLYVNALGQDINYQRHTATLSLVFTTD